ncbi:MULTISPECIES: MATE family efflux transporter [unclassified Methanoregula]|uniref:MATE family efflux transporter n=1 Tax=unclassified Methanoregula TaxID=2649730 RepID=UPI0009D1E484|nr:MULTISPECIES: MATE family efflux transporter [unclassified Methanoregula]OPX64065.1 MAG: multidrug efflux pump VmrA [Methanoregula sp. PtaB.Bin085]OPY33737.1 MAG: multidrug efflux pump VmrA [Methanoregula sp. PtaU1.Bin006]
MSSDNPPGSGSAPRPGNNATDGVSLLMGDPKTAILRLSGPMIVAMFLMSTYNIVNAIWVAGLGPDALAAVGFVTPLFMILIGISNGLGAGVGSVISRRIGAGDKAGADNAAVHALLLVVVVSAVFTIPLILLTGPIVALFGAGATAGLATEYGQVVFLGMVLILFTNIAYAILRAEGDAKRAMYVMGASSCLNMVLDPLLIYSAGLGIAGAAWGMIVSLLMVSAVLIYWFFGKKDTYVTIAPAAFSYDRKTVRDILGVGLPASVEFFLMSILAIFINGLLVATAGTDAVAVYTAGWRVVFFAIIPMIAIATAVISVAGAAYGARKFEKILTVHTFSITLGIAIAIVVSAITYIFARQIAVIFTYSPESAHLGPEIAAFLAVMCFFYPFIPPGVMSGSIFQATGRGMTSLVITVLRNLLFIAVFAYLFGIVLGYGEHGVWWGIVAGDILGGLVAFLWARYYISRLIANG